jgi:hypothetical protein
MITAEQARGMMPNIEPLLSDLEQRVRESAERGETSVYQTFKSKHKHLDRRLLVETLHKLGYTISYQDKNTIKISWKKL